MIDSSGNYILDYDVREGILRKEPIGTKLQLKKTFLTAIERRTPTSITWRNAVGVYRPGDDDIVTVIKMADYRKKIKVKYGRRIYLVDYEFCSSKATRVLEELTLDPLPY